MSIFDDLVQGINREVVKIQDRSQELMQTYALNSQIRALEGKKSAALIEIGGLVFDRYQRHREVPEDTLKEKTAEIVGWEHEITLLQAELTKLKMQHDPDSSTSQRASAKAGCAPTPGFTCPHCQCPANIDKAFCPSCGGELSLPSSNTGPDSAS